MTGVESIVLVVAVNDADVLGSSFMRSVFAQQIGIPVLQQEGFASASRAYNDAMDSIDADVVVFVHQDVYLPCEWESQLRRALEQAPRAAVLGVFGIDAHRTFHGRVWSQGLRAELDFRVVTPTPVCALDELVLVVRINAGLRFDPDLPGYHLYGTDITQRAIHAGFDAVVFDGPVVHNSTPVRTLDQSYETAYRHMQRKWASQLPIQTCILSITTDDEALHNWHKRNFRRQWSRKIRALLRPHKRLADPQKKAIALGYEQP